MASCKVTSGVGNWRLFMAINCQTSTRNIRPSNGAASAITLGFTLLRRHAAFLIGLALGATGSALTPLPAAALVEVARFAAMADVMVAFILTPGLIDVLGMPHALILNEAA